MEPLYAQVQSVEDGAGRPATDPRIYLALWLYATVEGVGSAQGSEPSPRRALASDSPEVAAWRQRMGTPEAKEIYELRAATAECVNAIARNRGFQRFLVRGTQKARAVALWFAITHNMMRALSLRAAAAPA